MNTTTKTLITLSALSLLLVGCDLKKKDDKADAKATTIEQIQAEKGKPARVAQAVTAKLNDIRSFSGSIEGTRQNNAISKMPDPIAKIRVQVGSTVKKDQVLAEYVYTGDNTSYQQSSEQVSLLEKSTARLRQVFEKGGISQQELDQAESQLKIAKMNMETARRATKILAPEAGVVTSLNYKVGQVPGVNSVFCTIAKLDKVILKLNVTSRDIGLFTKDAKATVKLNGEAIEGKVSLIPLAADDKRFFPVEITFDNKDKKLLPGMFVTAEIEARQVEGTIVPAEAIVYRNGVNTVWTVQKDGTAKRHVVKVGVQTKESVQILEGINAGETVMVEGMSRMNEGDKVLVVK